MFSTLHQRASSLVQYIIPRQSPTWSEIPNDGKTTLNDCIAQTRRNIYHFVSIIELCQWGLLTVGRSVKTQLQTTNQTCAPKYLLQVESLISKCSLAIADGKNQLEENNKPPPTPVQLAEIIRASMVKSKPQPVDPSEMNVDLPTTLREDDLTRLQGQMHNLDVALQLLVLKQAELEVDADVWIEALSFWVGVHEDLKTGSRSSERRSSSQSIPEADASSFLDGTASDGRQMPSFRRKHVPVRAILERIQAKVQIFSPHSEIDVVEENVLEDGEGMDKYEWIDRDEKRHDSGVNVAELEEAKVL